MRAHAMLLEVVMHPAPRTCPRKLILIFAATWIFEADFYALRPQVIFHVNEHSHAAPDGVANLAFSHTLAVVNAVFLRHDEAVVLAVILSAIALLAHNVVDRISLLQDNIDLEVDKLRQVMHAHRIHLELAEARPASVQGVFLKKGPQQRPQMPNAVPHTTINAYSCGVETRAGFCVPRLA